MYRILHLKSLNSISRYLTASTALALAISMPATAASLYCLTDLGTLGGTESRAYDLNDSGQVIGYSYLNPGSINYHAFLWNKNSGMTDLGTLGGSESQSLGINNVGQVVGSSTTATGQQLGFLWDSTNGMQSLATFTGGIESTAYGINNAGVIVGSAINASGKEHAVKWENGVPIDQDPGYTTTQTQAHRVNNSGQVTGSVVTSTTSTNIEHARFTGLDGLLNLLDTRVSNAYDINDLGQAVGYAVLKGKQQAVLYSITPTGLKSQVLASSSYLSSTAQGINNIGQSVGYGATTGGDRALLWNAPNQAIDLNTVIDSDSGWLLNQALGINNQGQIVGSGLIDGQIHGFLLTPNTETVLSDFYFSDSSGQKRTSFFEGESIFANLSATDDGKDAIAFLVNDQVVGTDTDTSGIRSTVKELNTLFDLSDEGSFAFTGQAKDEWCCQSNTIKETISILNAPPIIKALTQNLTIWENDVFNFFVDAQDPGIKDKLSFNWDLNNDGTNDFVGQTGQFSFSYAGNYQLKVQVADEDGGVAYGTVNVKVQQRDRISKVPESTSGLSLLILGAFGLGYLRQKHKN